MSNQSWLRGRTVVYNASTQTIPVKQENLKSKTSWFDFFKSIFCFAWKTIKGFALFIGLLFLFLIAMGIWGASKGQKSAPATLPNSMVLTLKLDGEIPETSGTTQVLSLLQMDKAPLTLDDIVNSIDRAAKDDRVKVLAVKASGGGYNLTQLQSIRDAVLRFKAAGKKSVIFSESYGEGGYGLGIYYLATAFDEIWMQPVGNVAIGGVNMQIPFFKDIMADYGVKAQFFQRKEYKNAMEHLTSNQMSAASREEMQSIVNDLAGQLVDPIKTSRKQVSQTFDALLDKGYLTDSVALETGIIDKLNYEDVMFDAIQKKFVGAQNITLERYAANYKRKVFESSMMSKNKGTTIAVIPIEGMIISGSAKSSPFGMNDKMAGADDIVAAIEDAAMDSSVRAIVLRINSPGGSPTASETIHRAVVWAKTTKKKPIIVSMGGLAASGGYWVATPADRIYAMDSTLTGSIGVVGGKLNLQAMWDKFHVRWETINYGENSGMLSFNTPFSPTEQAQFEESLDNIYDYFIKRVADGRHMTPEQVEKIAKGRAYTGRQAIKLGLVDEIGGMDKVLDDLAKANKEKSRDNLNLVYLPQTNDPMELFMLMLSEKIGMSPVLEKVGTALAPFMAMDKLNAGGAVYDQSLVVGKMQN
ncbi:MAG: signal peptide peptidase SppA [Alphaproteobacteria bacterium RIFCSPHIGHO2_02_FULL_46_13]|nr:MAG: signal peptide peptidase SppA [Alphaproteobacteria bacterium RIFCSPHIGHO2_02_FULL_46_13]